MLGKRLGDSQCFVEGGVYLLITGNIRHYPVMPFIMTPADFLGSL